MPILDNWLAFRQESIAKIQTILTAKEDLEVVCITPLFFYSYSLRVSQKRREVHKERYGKKYVILHRFRSIFGLVTNIIYLAEASTHIFHHRFIAKI